MKHSSDSQFSQDLQIKNLCQFIYCWWFHNSHAKCNFGRFYATLLQLCGRLKKCMKRHCAIMWAFKKWKKKICRKACVQQTIQPALSRGTQVWTFWHPNSYLHLNNPALAAPCLPLVSHSVVTTLEFGHTEWFLRLEILQTFNQIIQTRRQKDQKESFYIVLLQCFCCCVSICTTV